MARPSPAEVLEMQVGPWAAKRIIRKLGEHGYVVITKAERQALERAAARLQKVGGQVPRPVGRKALSA